MDDLYYSHLQHKLSVYQTYVLKGIFLGYSKESILAFCIRSVAMDAGIELEDEDTRFYRLGFIPSDRESRMTLLEVFCDINSRRFASSPFPCDELIESDEFKTFILKLPESASVMYSDYHEYILENLPYEA